MQTQSKKLFSLRNLVFMLVLVLSFGTAQIQAQLQCGMSTADQLNLQPNDRPLIGPRSAKNYIPLQFHLFADDDGTGALDVGTVLNELKAINEIYDTVGFYFYLANGGDIPTISNTALTGGPSGYDDLIEGIRNDIALNVFISKDLFVSSGKPVAGYYTPAKDFVAMDASYINDGETLAHELGHFFSLPHTFFGWEDDPYDLTKHGNPVTITQAPSYGVPVELVNKTNCTKAGDRICDTPPDYNFGAARNGCSYNTVIKDPNGEVIPIMENNYMSYFANCPDFQFTEGQRNAMRNNFALPSRNYLRYDYVPLMDTISELVTIISPASNQRIETYNYVTFEWLPVTNATRYYIEITDGRELTKAIASGTSYTFTTLKANKSYIVKIRPYSEGFTDTKNRIISFRTGNLMTATTEITGANRYLKVVPNPVQNGNNIKIEVDAGGNGDHLVEVFNMMGQLLSSKRFNFDYGKNTILLDDIKTQAGVHFVRIRGNKHDLTQKFIIAD